MLGFAAPGVMVQTFDDKAALASLAEVKVAFDITTGNGAATCVRPMPNTASAARNPATRPKMKFDTTGRLKVSARNPKRFYDAPRDDALSFGAAAAPSVPVRFRTDFSGSRKGTKLEPNRFEAGKEGEAAV